MSSLFSWTWKVRAAILIALAGAVTAGLCVFLAVGDWLVVRETATACPAVAVLGGSQPLRAFKAAELYRQGLAKEIWLTNANLDLERTVLRELGIPVTPEYEQSRQVLAFLGVPPPAVRPFGPEVQNTAGEIRAIAAEARRRGFDRVIIVSSQWHTRRIRILWDKLVGRYPEAIMQCSTIEPYDGRRWWSTTDNVLNVAREMGGILNAWLGFPLPTERIVDRERIDAMLPSLAE